MSRADINIDITSGDDLIFDNSNNPFFNESQWEGEEGGYPVLGVRLAEEGANVLQPQNELSIDTFTKIPKSNVTENKFLIYFYYIDNLGNRTETAKHFAIDEKQRSIAPFNAQKIDKIGHNLIYDPTAPETYLGRDGGIIVRTFENGDFFIEDSIEQNEKMLLIANKGNMLSNPTNGVEITREINGISDRDGVKKRIRNEFSRDELKITRLEISTVDGTISVDSEELFKNQ